MLPLIVLPLKTHAKTNRKNPRKIRKVPKRRKSGVWRRGESARGETAILGCGDRTRNMFGTSLHTTYCKLSIALETAEKMHWFFDHCKLLRRMNYCDSKQLFFFFAATPLAESTPSPNSQKKRRDKSKSGNSPV